MARWNIILYSVIPTWWLWQCTWHLLLQFQGIWWLDQTNFQTVWLDPKTQVGSPQNTEQNKHMLCVSTNMRHFEGLTDIRVKRKTLALNSCAQASPPQNNIDGTSNITVLTYPWYKNALVLLSSLHFNLRYSRSNSHPRLLCTSSSCYSGPWLYDRSLISGRNSL